MAGRLPTRVRKVPLRVRPVPAVRYRRNPSSPQVIVLQPTPAAGPSAPPKKGSAVPLLIGLAATAGVGLALYAAFKGYSGGGCTSTSPCSTTCPTGVCSDPNQTCVSGTCVSAGCTSSSPCSAACPNGVCSDPTKTCVSGVCTKSGGGGNCPSGDYVMPTGGCGNCHDEDPLNPGCCYSCPNGNAGCCSSDADCAACVSAGGTPAVCEGTPAICQQPVLGALQVGPTGVNFPLTVDYDSAGHPANNQICGTCCQANFVYNTHWPYKVVTVTAVDRGGGRPLAGVTFNVGSHPPWYGVYDPAVSSTPPNVSNIVFTDTFTTGPSGSVQVGLLAFKEAGSPDQECGEVGGAMPGDYWQCSAYPCTACDKSALSGTCSTTPNSNLITGLQADQETLYFNATDGSGVSGFLLINWTIAWKETRYSLPWGECCWNPCTGSSGC
jgi:hypothetical protein